MKLSNRTYGVGYRRNAGVECLRTSVDGMDCPIRADDISRGLHRLEGVEDVRVDVVGGSVKVACAKGQLARGDLHSAVRRLGCTDLSCSEG